MNLTTTATLPGTLSASVTLPERSPRSLGYLVDSLSNMRTPIKGSLMIIGRETGLVLNGISRKHCMIRVEDGEFHVADMDSRYGTYVNNEKLAPNVWRPLTTEDELRLGGSVFRLELPPRSRSQVEKVVKRNMNAVREETVAPNSDAAAEGLELASLHDRFRAAAVNTIITVVLGMILGLVFPQGPVYSIFVSLFVNAICSYIPMIYWGQTLGKRFVGLKVVQEDGSPIDWQIGLFRELMMKDGSFAIALVSLGALAGINQIFFLFFCIALPSAFIVKTRMDGMPYWDLICGTRVVMLEQQQEAVAAEPATRRINLPKVEASHSWWNFLWSKNSAAVNSCGNSCRDFVSKPTLFTCWTLISINLDYQSRLKFASVKPTLTS